MISSTGNEIDKNLTPIQISWYNNVHTIQISWYNNVHTIQISWYYNEYTIYYIWISFSLSLCSKILIIINKFLKCFLKCKCKICIYIQVWCFLYTEGQIAKLLSGLYYGTKVRPKLLSMEKKHKGKSKRLSGRSSVSGIVRRTQSIQIDPDKAIGK